MDNVGPLRSQDVITWEFSLVEQGFITRFGRLGQDYYKQVLPGGLLMHDRHPPKRVDLRVYQMAQRRHKAQQSNPAR